MEANKQRFEHDCAVRGVGDGGGDEFIDRNDTEGMVVLHNLAPQWSDEHLAYIMRTIGSRKLVSSVKNFQV